MVASEEKEFSCMNETQYQHKTFPIMIVIFNWLQDSTEP